MKIREFFLYLLLVIIGTSFIDVILRITLTPFFNDPPIQTKASGIYKFVSFKEPANIVILGASKANHHYRSSQIEDSLGVSVYNYGWDGRCTLYQYLCLLKALENGEVKTVILDLSPSQLSDEWVYERISDLYPYYWESDTIKDMVDRVEKMDMSWLMMSALVQFNSQYLNMIAPMPSEKGYIPLAVTSKPVSIPSKLRAITERKMTVNQIAEDYFNKISSLCKGHNIRFLVCLSPSLNMSEAEGGALEELCKKNDVECWNMAKQIEDPFLFSDLEHLNDKGAEIFTNEIIRQLK